ncbi:MAG: twin-arginine translocase TatA/TatE family subunit [Deltaproteobacteria bacterium]|nr:twin-arginine translocase TatA/TatE family subunit [Deltaproteobacteria bacterium]
MIGWTEILVVAAIILVVFGGTRLPGVARGLGQAVRNFRHAVRGDDGVTVRKIEQDEIKPGPSKS